MEPGILGVKLTHQIGNSILRFKSQIAVVAEECRLAKLIAMKLPIRPALSKGQKPVQTRYHKNRYAKIKTRLYDVTVI